LGGVVSEGGTVGWLTSVGGRFESAERGCFPAAFPDSCQ
jgi:hypothetical protein